MSLATGGLERWVIIDKQWAFPVHLVSGDREVWPDDSFLFSTHSFGNHGHAHPAADTHAEKTSLCSLPLHQM